MMRVVGCALLAALLMVGSAQAAKKPKVVRTTGAVTDTTDTTIVVQLAGKKNADAPPVTLTVGPDTVYAEAAMGVVTDAVVGATVAVVPDVAGTTANALALVVYQPAKDSLNAQAAAEGTAFVLARQVRAKGAGKAPKTIVGKVTAVDGAKLTVDGGGPSYTVTTGETTLVNKLTDKAKTDIVKGAAIVGVSGTDMNAVCILLGVAHGKKQK
jgi:hypothetical protein